MNDKRFAYANGEAITRLRMEKGWTQPDLVSAAHGRVSLDSIKRAENGARMQLGTLVEIAKALGVPTKDIIKLDDLGQLGQDSIKNYTWEEVLYGAKNVGEEIFKDGDLRADAVLTFPGTSLIFTGLVLATIPLEVFIRVPVYTAIFLEKTIAGKLTGFDEEPTPLFRIFIPRALTGDRSKKIVVIDDTVITGITMKALRNFFKTKHFEANVRFACCVAYDTRTSPPYEELPEAIGLALLEREQKFRMPWGAPPFSFGDGFLQHLRAQQP